MKNPTKNQSRNNIKFFRMPQTREERLEYQRQYKINNKEHIKQWRIDNAEKIAKYNFNNKEKRAKYNKQYQQTPQGRKVSRINMWKKRGIKLPDDYPDWDIFYHEEYLKTTHCEECLCKLSEDKLRTSTTKCLDHSHITGEFRNILCNICNIRRGEK